MQNLITTLLCVILFLNLTSCNDGSSVKPVAISFESQGSLVQCEDVRINIVNIKNKGVFFMAAT